MFTCIRCRPFRTIGSIPAFLLALVLCSCARQVGRCTEDISEVTVHYWTGHVVPSWSENYVISPTRVHLTRTGEPGSEVNAGTWAFDVDPADVALLFEQLQAIRWASVRAIPPDGPVVDGGASTTYAIICGRDSGPTLSYREGWTVANGSTVTEPIDALIAGLSLPEDAGRFIAAVVPD
jgi:hypothetical protein